MESSNLTHVHDIHALQQLFLEGRHDDIHKAMSYNPDHPIAITSSMRVWYGKLLEMLGEDSEAHHQYILAGSDGDLDRLRNQLRTGSSVDEIIHQVIQTNNPKAAAFLARFLESSCPKDSVLHETILRLYCNGGCLDYAAWLAYNHGEHLIQALLSVIENKSLYPPMRKVEVLLSHFEVTGDYESKIRLMGATRDGLLLAARECINRREPLLLRELIRQHRLGHHDSVSSDNCNIRDDIIKMIRDLGDAQVLFDFYLDAGMIPELFEPGMYVY